MSIQFDFKNSGIAKSDINTLVLGLESYREELKQASKDTEYTSCESSLALPSDKLLLENIQRVVKEKKSKELKYVFVIGIGGSNLGTKAIYDALRGRYDAYQKVIPKIIFIDTVSPNLLEQVAYIIKSDIKKSDEVLLNVISKSGTTAETISNFEYIYSLLSRKFKNIDRRIIFTTDKGSKLWNEGMMKGITTMEIQKQVGGRFSVFSAVGLLPLALSDIDIVAFRKGASSVVRKCVKMNMSPASHSAAVMCAQRRKKIRINNNFFFNPELESLGKWYRQLMGESIGKKKNTSGRVVNEGITPIVSIGSTDLHSMAQLYFGGPKDKYTTLIYAGAKAKAKIPSKLKLENLVTGIAGKDISFVMNAIYQGVKKAYQKNKLPFVEVSMKLVNEESIGAYMQMKMIEIMYVAKLLNINAFDQPNVEDYKVETKKIMKGK